MLKTKYKDVGCQVNRIESIDAAISSRGGLLFFLRYLDNIQFFNLVEKTVTGIRGSAKGKSVGYMLRQILAYFIDGSMKAISGFDLLHGDAGYAATLEVNPENLVSSHSVKRFFGKFSLNKCFMLRKVLNTLFIWRLRIEKPKEIILDIDTMVLNNDDAQKRQGVSPTYKKKKGFQPLQVTWRGIIVDAIFRRGSAHSNHGKDVQRSIKRVVDLIRSQYQRNIPIILTSDSGFLDEKNLHYFDKTLKILFVCNGKLYQSVLEYVRTVPRDGFRKFSNGQIKWEYVEFGNRLDSWKRIGFLRTIFTRLVSDDNGQMLMDFTRPDTLIYTNIGRNAALSKALVESGGNKHTKAQGIISLAHGRGRDELTNRSLKDFMVTEHMPFKRFGMNAAYYYIMLIGHSLQNAYQRDVTLDLAPQKIVTYPSTFRRNFIDFAGKIVRSGHVICLQIANAVFKRLDAAVIWARCISKEIIPIPLIT